VSTQAKQIIASEHVCVVRAAVFVGTGASRYEQQCSRAIPEMQSLLGIEREITGIASSTSGRDVIQ